MEEELFDIVDKEDNIIKKSVEEKDLHINNDITRVVTIYVFDKDNNFSISQRVASKKVDPLKFEAPAHGRVNTGEDYETAARRETLEELNVHLEKIVEISHHYLSFNTNVGIRQHFKKLYIGYTKEDIKKNSNEINDMKSFQSVEEFFSFYKNNKSLFSNAVELDICKLKSYFQ
jgi:isopentenyldiphosphate isomerase